MGGRRRISRIRRKKAAQKDSIDQKAPAPTEGVRLTLAHWNARALRNKEELFKQFLKTRGVTCAGVVETHLYKAPDLSDIEWVWEPGSESCPKPQARHPPKGMGMFTHRKAAANVVEVCEYSMWCRIETGGDPVFVGECYFPHATNIQEHRKAWKETRDVVERTRNMGHIVLMGDFNAHLGMNGDHRVDSAGKLMKEQLNAMRLHVVNGFK